jgi:hypothetical protein
MRPFIVPIAIAMLTLAGASPAAAQSKPASDQGTSVGMAAPRDAAAERNSFTQQAQDEVRVWERKLNDFDAKAKVKATDVETRASKDVDDAWAQTKTAFARLETAGEKDWDSAKTSFKSASDKLAVTWKRVNPADK